MAEKRPNFLFVITDQHRADYLGCSGHPFLKTPTIDSLAERGTRFDRFYVASPVCMPNRASLMTGRLPSVTGARGNGLPLPLQANTFVDLLRADGYRTALSGKSHLQNMTDGAPRYDTSRGDDLKVLNGNFAEALKPYTMDMTLYDQEKPARWVKERRKMHLPFYGFDRVHLCSGHGDMVGADYPHWLRDKGQDPDKLRGRDNAQPSDYVAPQAWRTSVPEELYPTSYIRDHAIQCLTDWSAEGGGNPFFLMLSFPDPHHPFTPPGKYWDMYSPDQVELPASFHSDRPNVANAIDLARATEDNNPNFDRDRTMVFLRVDEREAKEAIALTCGMITMIDDALARVVQKLKDLDQFDNTVIVFTADHGDFLGDHGLMLKGPLHLQATIKVPFIWSDPAANGAAGSTLSSLASTIDIGPTILHRAGLGAYNGVQGRTLLTDMETGTDTGSGDIVVEEESQHATLGIPAPVQVRSMVTERWRMTLYGKSELAELYDLENDPSELRNLWDDPDYADVKAEMLERMVRRSIDHVDRSPLPLNMA